MKMLKGKYQVADTVFGNIYREHLSIRLAPVKLAGYDGFLTLHTTKSGSISSVVWSRAAWNVFGNGDERWESFTAWRNWPAPTRNDAQIIYNQLDKVYKKLVDTTLVHLKMKIKSPRVISHIERDTDSTSQTTSRDAEDFPEREWILPNGREITIHLTNQMLIVKDERYR
jgi:hypothetical protein